MAAQVQYLPAQATALAADGQRAAGVVRLPGVHGVLPQGGPVQGQAAAVQQGRQFLRCAGIDGAAEHGPHGRAHRLPAVGVGAAAGEQQAVGVEGVQRPQDGAYVAGVLHPVQQHIPPAGEGPGQGSLRQAAGEKHPLRGLYRGDGGHDVLRHLHLPDVLRKPGQGGDGHHGGDLRLPQQGLLQQLGTVAEEFPRLPPVGGGAGQPADMAHEGVVTAGDVLHGGSFPGVFMHRRDDLTPYSKGFLR